LPTVVNGVTFDHFNQFQSLGDSGGLVVPARRRRPGAVARQRRVNSVAGAAKLERSPVQLDNLAGSWQAEIDRTGEYTYTTSQTLLIDHWNAVVGMNAAGATTVTVPPNSTVAFPVGATVDVLRYGAGTVAISPGAGVTIRSRGNLTSINGQYGIGAAA
jgi:hypothetical protein